MVLGFDRVLVLNSIYPVAFQFFWNFPESDSSRLFKKTASKSDFLEYWIYNSKFEEIELHQHVEPKMLHSF